GRRTARRRLGGLSGRGRRRRRLGDRCRSRGGGGRGHGGGAGGVLLGLEAFGQLLGQFTRGGGRHLGHDGGKGPGAHGRGDRQAHTVVQSGEDGRRLLGPHGGIDGDQTVGLGLF